jgi:hypothetical protein
MKKMHDGLLVKMLPGLNGDAVRLAVSLRPTDADYRSSFLVPKLRSENVLP